MCYNEEEQGKEWQMGDTKIQWHPGFVAAMSLEFEDNRDNLIFEKEYNLNTGPLEIDLLVIKKEPGVRMVNDIGKLFRGRNIMEYSVLEVSILNAVRSFRDLGADDKRIQEILVKNYELTPEEAIQYL